MPNTSPKYAQNQALSCSTNSINGLALPSSTKLSTRLARFATRFVTFSTGALVLVASTIATQASLQSTSTEAALSYALCASLIVASATIGRLPALLGIVLGFGLAFAELSQAANNAARVAAKLDQQQSITLALNDTAVSTKATLARAESALADHHKSAVTTAALPSCRAGCLEMLAKTEIKLESNVASAREALKSAPPQRATNPLADKLGLPSSTLDLAMIALSSLAVTLIGSGLIAASTGSFRASELASESIGPGNTTITAASPALIPSEPTVDMGKSATLDTATERRTKVIAALKAGALEGRQADLARTIGVPRTSLRRIVDSEPMLRLKALPNGVSRLELVA